MKHNYGAILSPPDPRDFHLGKFLPGFSLFSFPQQFDVPGCTFTVYDQGQTEMCVAFALCQLREAQEQMETGTRPRFSEMWVYGDRPKSQSHEEGLSIRNALSALIKDGIIPYADLPGTGTVEEAYTQVQVVKAKDLPEAQQMKSLRYIKCTMDIDVKSALMKYGPAIFCLAVTEDFETAPGGVVPPMKQNAEILGYHGVCVVGWEVKAGKPYWKVINSWGTSWGDAGYCYIPVGYGGIAERWSIVNTAGPIVLHK